MNHTAITHAVKRTLETFEVACAEFTEYEQVLALRELSAEALENATDLEVIRQVTQD